MIWYHIESLHQSLIHDVSVHKNHRNSWKVTSTPVEFVAISMYCVHNEIRNKQTHNQLLSLWQTNSIQKINQNESIFWFSFLLMLGVPIISVPYEVWPLNLNSFRCSIQMMLWNIVRNHVKSVNHNLCPFFTKKKNVRIFVYVLCIVFISHCPGIGRS